MQIRRIILFFIIFIILQINLFSETSSSDNSSSERPKVALVLGGGGAKGFAEIPVIELIEQMDIPIDIVIGTSFGSIVGGMYCAGYSLPEIYETMAYTDWTPLFSDYEVSPYESVLGKHSIYNNILNLTLGLDMSLKLGKGLSNGQNVYQLFKSFTLKYPSNIDFDNLIIPFRTVTTDMLTGEAIVLKRGDVAEAVRASMSIPGVFQPFCMDENYYMDGGLRYNLPINIAKDMGYDII
ncbi:MAG: patatin-like phospholipase family protein, partial [Treponema sp.]|nr:patatin-like phospholipase family protein [Treponema sp.]